ncbi:Cna B-type domain-containing protein [Faecalicoccus pleomorphus]|uniref:Cna B-type domain-containing protein n=1 Tax=Faecalicoccus pleomorphus TaxID=1323 RepID=UPI0019600C7E|nr:Cna B-type domain-containing protein [Faecalicoccus pleomorphus]MBM6677452.1 Cna B-type domain-containing protein [Faecalicoccus pleomorphus]
MKRFKKLSTTFLTTVLLACNTITSPGFNVWAQEEIPIDNQMEAAETTDSSEELPVPEEPVVEKPVQQEETTNPQPQVEEPVQAEEQYPLFEKSVDVKDGPTVKIKALQGAFPEGIQVAIQKVDVNTIYDLLYAQDKTIQKKDIIALDFDFYKENQHHIEPKQKISITVEDLDVSKATKASLYHMDNETAIPKKEEIQSLDADNGKMTFESDTFSIHALVLSNEETNETVQPNTATEPEEKPAVESEDPSTSTDLYDSSINLAPGTSDTYYGGEIITVYDNISVSGNNTVVPEGAYTIVSLPKASFQKPRESEVSTSFDNFKSLEIKETDTDYQIILTYKTLYGGYNGGTPIRVNLLPGQVINKSQHTITQQFFNKDGKQLTKDSTQIIKAKAEIESLQSNNYGSTRLIKEVDSDFVVKEGTYVDFYAYYYSISSNQSDPRDRRLYATIPEGCKVKENTGWTYEPETNRYYRDIPRDKFNDNYDSTLQRSNRYYRTITLDLGGIDLSSYDASNKAKRFKVDFSVQPVVGEIVQKDLGPYTGEYSKSFYILKEEPKPEGASPYWYNAKFEKIIDKDYHSIDGSTYESTSNYKYTTISYNKDYLYTHRMRYTLKNISSWSLSNANAEDEEIRELTIRDSRVDISPYVEPHQIRLMLIGLKDEDAKWMKEQLTGTKAYGITSSGQKVLISDNVPIHIDSSYSNSFDGEDWQTISNTENYTKVEFVYPNGGVTLKGKDQIERCKYAIYSDVIGRVKESTYETLKGYIDAHQPASLAGPFEYGNTSIASKYYKFAEDTELTSKADTRSPSWTYDYIRMQMEKIINYSNLYITNGSQFFTNDTISTQEAYRHSRIGNFSEATQPENLNVYYLVPDGLEPVEDTSGFESIEVVRGYKDGMNLVIARPKSVKIPKLDGTLERGTENWFYLDFTATTRLDIGRYTILSCMSYDNNKIGVDPNGNQYGILQDSSPGGRWSTILKDANNRPDDNTRFTNFNSSSFKIYPPKVLSAIKEVKLTSEPDSKYASSLGSKATIGDQIDYRWVLKNNSNAPIDQLEILDILPDKGDHAIVHNDAGEYPARGSLFTTPLLSIEDNSKFDYYYSTDPVKQTTQENYKANWSSSVDDLSKVTMIKAVLKKGQTIPVGENAYIITHNQIVNDPKIQDGDKAYNSFAYTLNEGTSFMEALRTEVQVTYPKRDVLVEKVNVDDDSYKLFGATFNLYEEGTGENGSDKLILSDVVTNHDGIATFPNLLVGKEYYLQETKAPSGYVKTDTKTYFTVKPPINDTDVQKILIQNDVPRTTMHLQKEWIGPQNAQEVTIHILANEKDTGQTVVLKAVDDWKTSVENLPVNDKNGNPIAYSIQEDAGKNYSSSIRGDMESGFVITNTNTEKRDVSVSKTWIGPKQDSVQVTLIKDGTPTDQTLTLQEANEWKSSFEDLIKYDPTDGHEIVYTVQENEISDYSLQMTGDMDNGFVLTNTNTETLSIPVTKSWIGPAQAKAIFTLYQDGKKTNQTLVLSKQDQWQGSFTDLAKYDHNDGHAYVYTIEETQLPDYDSKVEGNMKDGFTVTNTNTEAVNVPVEKKWIGPAASKVDILLVKDGIETDRKLTLNEWNHWKGAFNDLTKYDSKDGHEIQYAIKEIPIADYSSDIKQTTDGYVVTNTNMKTRSISVEKRWIGPKADQVMVALYADGKDTGQSLTLSEENEWKAVFDGLSQYDSEDGHEISYSIQEKELPNYTVSIEGDMVSGFVLTNTNVSKRNITVSKKWIGQEGKSATIYLKQDGQRVQTVRLTQECGWQYEFKDLVMYDVKDGHAISYEIEEEEQPGYTSKITGNMEDGFIATNTQITSDSKSKGSTPTGESFDGTSMIVLAITSVVMLIALWIVKRKGL